MWILPDSFNIGSQELHVQINSEASIYIILLRFLDHNMQITFFSSVLHSCPSPPSPTHLSPVELLCDNKQLAVDYSEASMYIILVRFLDPNMHISFFLAFCILPVAMITTAMLVSVISYSVAQSLLLQICNWVIWGCDDWCGYPELSSVNNENDVEILKHSSMVCLPFFFFIP